MTTADFLYSLAGHISHQGLPVSGVVVCAYEFAGSTAKSTNRSVVPIAEQKTGAKGEFTFALKPGKYKLEIMPQSTTRFLRHSVPEIRVTTNTTLNVNLSTGSILQGTVKNSCGRKLRSCEVVALGIEPSAYKSSASVDEEGNYHIILPKGKYYLAPRAVLDRQSSTDRDPATTENSDCKQVCFLVTQSSVLDVYQDNQLDIILPELVTLIGEIVDNEGQPIAGAIAIIYPVRSKENTIAHELGLVACSISDSLGRFEVEVQPGVYDIQIEPQPGSALFGDKESAVGISSDTKKRFVLTDGFQLHGQVMYEHSALPDCAVQVIGLDNEAEYLLKTDSQGKYSVAVRSGSYRLFVLAQSDGVSSGTVNGTTIDGIAPWTNKISVATDTEVLVHMQPGTAIKGGLCDDLGTAKSGIKVSVLPYTGKTPRHDQIRNPITSTVTNGDGKYCIFVSPGTYWLIVHKDIANARLVEVGSDTVNLNLSWHGWCLLKFQISGQDGQIVTRCRVIYNPYGRELDFDLERENGERADRGCVFTDEKGTCQITLPQGIYSFQFHPLADGSYGPKVLRQLSVSSNLIRNIELPLKVMRMHS